MEWRQEDTPNYDIAVKLSRHKNWVWLPGARALGGDWVLSRGDSITATFTRTEPGEPPSPRVPDFMDAATLGTMLWLLRTFLPEACTIQLGPYEVFILDSQGQKRTISRGDCEGHAIALALLQVWGDPEAEPGRPAEQETKRSLPDR